MGLAPLAFSGLSAYSADFQTILKRAKDIASIPLTRLQNESADLLQRKGLLDGLGISAGNVARSLEGLGKVGAGRALAAASSNTSVVSVRNTGATTPGIFTINEISQLAKAASETTLTGYASSTATPVSSTGTVKLILGSQQYTITLDPGENNLAGLRNRINALGARVTASILTTGTGETPNYLTLNAVSSGATTLRLVDDPDGAAADLLTMDNQGQDALFRVNGAPVARTSNVVNNVVAGLTFTLQAPTSSAVTLSLATERRQIATAIESFVAAYNTLVGDVGLQVGETAGLLSGNPIVYQIQESLRQTAGYRASEGTVRSLIDLGVSFDQTGVAFFDAAAFDALPEEKISGALDFLGSATTGFGALAAKFRQFSDPVSGLVRLEQSGYQAEQARLQRQIALLTDRINTQQRALTEKLQLADALLGRLESQQRVLEASIQSVQLALFGKKT
jgi:flagellar hook-associated protein 2